MAALTLLLLASLGCSVGQAVVGLLADPPPTNTPVRRPTFTGAPALTAGAATPGAPVRGDLPPGVTAAVPASNGGTPRAGETREFDLVLIATQTPQGGPTGAATARPARSATDSPAVAAGQPTAQPTPYAVVVIDEAVLRRGPGLAYEIVGQANKGEQLFVLGRSLASDWWRVCCVANQPVWIAADLVQVNNPTNLVPALTPAATPTATRAPTATRTPSPSPTSRPPFDIGVGPLYPIQRDNGILTIWVMAFEGPKDNQRALEGYKLMVMRDGADVSDGALSHGMPFDYTDKASEGFMPYNLKFEMRGAGEANWQIWLARADGSVVSPVTRFTTLGDSYRNQVVYIGYWLAR